MLVLAPTTTGPLLVPTPAIVTGSTGLAPAVTMPTLSVLALALSMVAKDLLLSAAAGTVPTLSVLALPVLLLTGTVAVAAGSCLGCTVAPSPSSEMSIRWRATSAVSSASLPPSRSSLSISRRFCSSHTDMT